MSERLRWTRPTTPGPHYSVHAGDYSVCKVGDANGWTLEVWLGREQLKVGLESWTKACAWAQRHHDRNKQQETRDADPQPS